jgi:sugar phosphate isomerase/epimerase
MIYATMPFKALDPASQHFRLIKNLGLSPEISFETGWADYSLSRHREMAKAIRDHFPRAAVHLPYRGLNFGREDNLAAKKSSMLKAVETANLYAPRHLVGHPSFEALTDSVLGPKKYPGFKRDNLTGLSQTPAPGWLARSIAVWSAVLKATDARLYLENTHEHSPEPIMVLLGNLDGRAGFCLDFGHWFHYAMGRHWDNLDFWLSRVAPKLAHAHVHDNNGEADQHLALGQGLIDYGKIRKSLIAYDLKPSFALENHQPMALLESFDALAQHPLWAEPESSLRVVS